MHNIQDYDMTDKIEYIGNCYPERRGGESEAQEGMVYGTDGISPTLGEAMGMGGNQVPKVTEIGNIYPATGNPQAGRIYDEQGISPALDTMEGGNRQPKILTPRRTDYGKAIRKDYESGNVQESRQNMTELTPRKDDCSNTLTSVRKDNLLLEQKHKYRIRRLTERECFRLMDVEEKDIDTIQSAGISGTQQYKMAGNSIVVACLYHLFRKLFTQPGNEEQQLSLF